jgi:hypothetical protein
MQYSKPFVPRMPYAVYEALLMGVPVVAMRVISLANQEDVHIS